MRGWQSQEFLYPFGRFLLAAGECELTARQSLVYIIISEQSADHNPALRGIRICRNLFWCLV